MLGWQCGNTPNPSPVECGGCELGPRWLAWIQPVLVALAGHGEVSVVSTSMIQPRTPTRVVATVVAKGLSVDTIGTGCAAFTEPPKLLVH